MLCKSPYTHKTGEIFPCGQCLPCRLNRRRVWAHRMMLESDCHEHNSFVTLTYDDNHLPKTGSLEPDLVKKWFKNFRDDYRKKTGSKLRFYLVGEYGDKSFRPHYHVIIFGYPSCLNEYRKKWLRKRGKGCDCDNCVNIQRSWGKGFTDVGNVTLHSVQYVAGYVTKKMTSKDDMRLKGRKPEFARMSNRPGIGALAVDYIAEALFDNETGELQLTEKGDVPVALFYAGKQLPLGRYLRSKLQEKLGITDELKKQNYEDWQASLRSMQLYDEELTSSQLQEKRLSEYNEKGKITYPTMSLKEYLLDRNKSKISKMERLHKIQQQRKSL